MQVRRKLLGVAGTAAATIVMVATLGTTAQADGGFAPVGARNSGHCLDVRSQDNFYASNARVQQWDCSGIPEQQWSFHPYATVPLPDNPDATITLYQIVSERSGMCMQVDGGGVHAQVRQNPCGTGSVTDLAHQLWRSVRVASTPSMIWVNLKPWSDPTLCADIAGASDDNGAMLQLFTCTGNTNQQFFGNTVISS